MMFLIKINGSEASSVVWKSIDGDIPYDITTDINTFTTTIDFTKTPIQSIVIPTGIMNEAEIIFECLC